MVLNCSMGLLWLDETTMKHAIACFTKSYSPGCWSMRNVCLQQSYHGVLKSTSMVYLPQVSWVVWPGEQEATTSPDKKQWKEIVPQKHQQMSTSPTILLEVSPRIFFIEEASFGFHEISRNSNERLWIWWGWLKTSLMVPVKINDSFFAFAQLTHQHYRQKENILIIAFKQ